jgi:hypothetical protein
MVLSVWDPRFLVFPSMVDAFQRGCRAFFSNRALCMRCLMLDACLMKYELQLGLPVKTEEAIMSDQRQAAAAFL